MKRILGGVMIATPFVALFYWAGATVGWGIAVGIFGAVALFVWIVAVLWMVAGILLMNP